MIRLRSAENSVVEIRDARFVELLGADGRLCTVLYEPSPGVTVQIMPGTEEARRYEQMTRHENLRFKSLS